MELARPMLFIVSKLARGVTDLNFIDLIFQNGIFAHNNRKREPTTSSTIGPEVANWSNKNRQQSLRTPLSTS